MINAFAQTEPGATWALPIPGVEALKPGSTGTAVPGHVYDNGVPVPGRLR